MNIPSPDEIIERFPSLSPLRVERDQDRVLFYAFGKKPLFTLDVEEEQVTLSCENGHTHADGVDSALRELVRLLDGESRWAEEYRGKRLATAWIETREDGLFVSAHSAAFLAPFDPDEWELWPGENWSIVRTWYERQPDGSIGVKSSRRETAEPEGVSREMFDWLPNALGHPPAGTRWTVSAASSALVFPAPGGWRQNEQDRDTAGVVDYAPAGEDVVLRVTPYFRESEDSRPGEHVTPMEPTSIEHRHEEARRETNGWAADVWDVLFAGYDMEMLARFRLYYRDGANVDSIRRLISGAMPFCRFVPHEWQMGG